MDLSQALEFASYSDAGMVRKHNEDSVAIDAANGLVVLADGMGGYNAGEVASGMATAIITTELQHVLSGRALHRAREGAPSVARRLLHEQITKANGSIYQAAQSEQNYSGMGTTVVTAIFYDNKIAIGHIGDSRLYRCREGRLEQLTKDHSLLQEQIDSGMLTQEQARFSQNKNMVTRALGIESRVDPEIHEFDTLTGDIYLFCSDGLNDMVADADIAMTLQALGGNLGLAARQLVQLANDNGGRDNISVILVRIAQEYPATRSWRDRLFGWVRPS